jgi:hypothetical protein
LWAALGLAALVAACRTPQPGTTLTGAAAPRIAVEQFLSAVRAQDLQAMSAVWGNEKGPARDQFERTELEKREIVIQSCLSHDKFRILDESPGEGGTRVLRVELTIGSVVRSPKFKTIRGPSDRWYVLDAEMLRCGEVNRQRP